MIKNIIISSVLVLFATTFTAAQNTERNNTLNIGIKGGYNLASVTDEDGNETDSRSGFQAGFYAENFIGEHFSIQPEVLFSQQGFKVESNNSTYTLKRDYINVPIMLKGYLADSFFIEAGPQIGIAVSKEKSLETSWFNIEEDSEPEAFDWGINVGTGLKLNATTIGVRYNFGMGDVYEDTDFKNRVLQVYVGLDF